MEKKGSIPYVSTTRNRPLINDPRLEDKDFENGKKMTCISKTLSVAAGCLAFSIIIAIAVVATLFFKGDLSSSSTSPPSNKTNQTKPEYKSPRGSMSRPNYCQTVQPKDRVVMFWQTEVKGCWDIPKGVTHMIYGFAEVGKKDSSVNEVGLRFQGNDTMLKQCVKDLRSRCIYVFGSIGGGNNVKELSKLNNPKRFADSAMRLLEAYDFDGIDIDDETVGAMFKSEMVVSYMKELHLLLKSNGNDYFLTWDPLLMNGVEKACTGTHSRCYPKQITKYIDWIHLMAYNVDTNVQNAKSIYAKAISTIFPEWISNLGNDPAKLVIGICFMGPNATCNYGPGPSNEVISQWSQYSRQNGGMMIYAGSHDEKYKVTKSILQHFDPPTK